MYEIHELARRKHIKCIYFDFNEILLEIVHGKIFATNFFFLSAVYMYIFFNVLDYRITIQILGLQGKRYF